MTTLVAVTEARELELDCPQPRQQMRITTGMLNKLRVPLLAAKATKGHNLVRRLFTASADLEPWHDGYLAIVLDPMPTKQLTKMLAELCEWLTVTQTVFPAAVRVLRYRVKFGKVLG